MLYCSLSEHSSTSITQANAMPPMYLISCIFVVCLK